MNQQLRFLLIYEPAMYTIQHISARPYHSDKTGITTVQHKHTKILGLKDKCQISSVKSADRGSLVTVVTCLSPNGHFIPPLLVFPKKMYKTQLMNDTPPGSIHACHPSGADTERDFHPVASSFHQTYKLDKIISLYLSTGRALFTHKEPCGHYFSSTEPC